MGTNKTPQKCKMCDEISDHPCSVETTEIIERQLKPEQGGGISRAKDAKKYYLCPGCFKKVKALITKKAI